MNASIPARNVTITPSRPLCGVSPAQFAELVGRLEPIWNTQRRERLDRQLPAGQRRRAVGGGKTGLRFPERLLVAFVYLKQNTGQRATAAICGVSQMTVHRCVSEVVRALAAHGFHPPGASAPIRTADELADWLREQAGRADGDGPGGPGGQGRAVRVDATEVPRERPEGWGHQRVWFSGKRRVHTLKTTVLAVDGRPCWVEGAVPGSVHDLPALTQHAPHAMTALHASRADALGDKAYQGLGQQLPGVVRTPAKRPQDGRLGVATRRANRQHAQARISVEHAIGRMKTWRVLRTFRLRLLPALTIRAVGVLASMV